MSLPLTVSHRIEFQWIVAGLMHKQRFYCIANPGSGASGYDLTARSGFSNADAKDVAERWINQLQPFTSIDQSAGVDYFLQARSGTAWNPIYAGSHTVTNGGAARIDAGSAILTLRDTAFNHVKTVFLEWTFAVPKRYVGYSALAAYESQLANFFSDHSTSPLDAWVFMRNRTGLNLAASGAIVGFVTDFNDKVRRARGLQ